MVPVYSGNWFVEKVKSRWACLPLYFRFYMIKKSIEAKSINAEREGKFVSFEGEMNQAVTMLKEVHDYYQQSLLVVADSWFGNDGLWSRLEKGAEGCFYLQSRMRTNITLYDFAPSEGEKRKVSRQRKYGDRLGRVDECAARWKEKASAYTVFLYARKERFSFIRK